MPELFCVEAHTVKVGGTMRVYWGTGYETGYCRVRVYSNGKTIVDEAVRGGSPVWFYELPIADEHRGKIEIETTFVRENRLYRNESVVWVPWDNQHLDIEAEHLTSKLHPGTQETWTFKVSGPAEVLAFLYDRSHSIPARRRRGPSRSPAPPRCWPSSTTARSTPTGGTTSRSTSRTISRRGRRAAPTRICRTA